jgi:hypothetical protein
MRLLIPLLPVVLALGLLAWGIAEKPERPYDWEIDGL